MCQMLESGGRYLTAKSNGATRFMKNEFQTGYLPIRLLLTISFMAITRVEITDNLTTIIFLFFDFI